MAITNISQITNNCNSISNIVQKSACLSAVQAKYIELISYLDTQISDIDVVIAKIDSAITEIGTNPLQQKSITINGIVITHNLQGWQQERSNRMMPRNDYANQRQTANVALGVINNQISGLQNPTIATAQSISAAAKQKRIWYAIFGILAVIILIYVIIYIRKRSK